MFLFIHLVFNNQIPPPNTPQQIKNKQKTTQPTKRKENQLQGQPTSPQAPPNPYNTRKAKELQGKPKNRPTQCKRIEAPKKTARTFCSGVPYLYVYADCF
jgi:hypothetical protein